MMQRRTVSSLRTTAYALCPHQAGPVPNWDWHGLTWRACCFRRLQLVVVPFGQDSFRNLAIPTIAGLAHKLLGA